MAAADWDRVEHETVEKIRLLKAAVHGMPIGPLADKICSDLVLPALAKLGAFNTIVTAQVEEMRSSGHKCEMCEGKGGRHFRGMGDWDYWTCPKCKGTGFILPNEPSPSVDATEKDNDN